VGKDVREFERILKVRREKEIKRVGKQEIKGHYGRREINGQRRVDIAKT